jgi:hypothetical protein
MEGGTGMAVVNVMMHGHEDDAEWHWTALDGTGRALLRTLMALGWPWDGTVTVEDGTGMALGWHCDGTEMAVLFWRMLLNGTVMALRLWRMALDGTGMAL